MVTLQGREDGGRNQDRDVGGEVRGSIPRKKEQMGYPLCFHLRVHAMALSKTAGQQAQWGQPGVFIGVLNLEIQTVTVSNNWYPKRGCPQGDVRPGKRSNSGYNSASLTY